MKPRSWLSRISLSLAILAGIAVVGLNVLKLKQKVETLHGNLVAQTEARQKAESDLARTRAELASTVSNLKQTKASLDEAIAEQQKAVASAMTQTKRAEGLSKQLAELQKEFDTKAAALARYEATGLDAEQVLYAAKQLKTYEKELASATAQAKELQLKVDRLLKEQGGGDEVTLPAGFKAKVLAADPKWHFVVLDAGENAGAVERGEVLLSRGGNLLARARVSRVHADKCIANLLPGWEQNGAKVMEGDSAIAAPPRL